MPLPFAQLAASIWRQYIVDGNPGSGLYNTQRPEIITWGTKVEEVLGEHDTDITALEAADVVHTAGIAANAADIVTLQGEVQPIARGGTGATDEAGAVAAFKSELVDALFPVGHVLIRVDNTHPDTLYPGTTWVAIAEGRALVGVGDNSERVWAEGEQFGSDTHTLLLEELPAHDHAVSGTTDAGGSHNHVQAEGAGINGGRYGFTNTGINNNNGSFEASVDGRGSLTSTAANHTHSFSATTDPVGDDGAHNNVQPSEAHYIWKRTA